MSSMGTSARPWISHGSMITFFYNHPLTKRFVCGELGTINALKYFCTITMFNPTDDSYFISGSIDGKVRVSSIDLSHVEEPETDISERIIAVTYNPNDKGGIIGSMSGCCHNKKCYTKIMIEKI